MSLRTLKTGRAKGGLTLIELVVVLGIIGALAAISLPAISSSRESARNVTCLNNLRQIGHAMQMHEEAFGRFPGGGWGYRWTGWSDLSQFEGQSGAWPYAILPFIDQQKIYRNAAYQGGAEQRDSALRTLVQARVSSFNCPERRGCELFDVASDCTSCVAPVGATGLVTSVFRGDYAVNIGDGVSDLTQLDWPIANFTGPADRAQAREWTLQSFWPIPPQDWSGISYLRTSIRSADISDGLQNTILLGEKYVNENSYHNGKDWGDNESLWSGFNNDNHRSTHPDWPLMRDKLGVMSPGSFGSAHRENANFVFVDGSVRRIPYLIDLQIFRALGNRFDGKDISPVFAD